MSFVEMQRIPHYIPHYIPQRFEIFYLKLLFEFLLYGSVCNCINLISQRQQKINVQLFLSTFYLSSDRITKSASL